MSTPKLLEVLATPAYVVTPCRDCDIPGYLILQPRHQTDVIAGMLPEALGELGALLARLETAIQAATNADHVYVLRFSESVSSVHFHLFPRTRLIADRWCQADPSAAAQGINAPLLFAWARLHWHVRSDEELSSETISTAASIAGSLVGRN